MSLENDQVEYANTFHNIVHLVVMILLHSLASLVQRAIDGGSNSKGTADDGTDSDQKARECFGAGFAVDDLHRGDILVGFISNSLMIVVHKQKLTYEKNTPGMPPLACNRSLWPSSFASPPDSDRLCEVTEYW